MNRFNTQIKEQGFTLLELIVAMAILVIALSIALQSFTGAISGWKRGTKLLDSLKHSEYTMLQLAKALNSTVYFSDDKKSYGFIKETEVSSTDYPSDSISWVTASRAFVPENSPFKHGTHRIRVYMDETEEGDPALFAEVRPIIIKEDEYEADPILISPEIHGIECLFYNEEDEDWTEDWEEENKIPNRIKITLYSPPTEEDDKEPRKTIRVFEIPVAASQELNLKGPTSGSQNSEGSDNPIPQL